MFLDRKSPTVETVGTPENAPVSRFRQDRDSNLWAIVLAGGQGARLRPLVERIHSDDRPKQYAVLVGERSLLRQTLDRSALVIPAERTVTVTTRSHSAYFASEFTGTSPATALVQPLDRGTAAGLLLPALWIAWRDPTAIVAVLPSDHFVSDDAAFMRHVASLAPVAERHPERILLVASAAESPETSYGWIQPGVEIHNSPSGIVHAVERFVEKPSAAQAQACYERGGLWNTFVMVARASAIVDASRRALPDLYERLRRIRPFVGTERESEAIEGAYALAPVADFSRSVLAAAPDRLGVSRLPALTWSDWGTPERVLETLRREGIAPRWLKAAARPAPLMPGRPGSGESLLHQAR